MKYRQRFTFAVAVLAALAAVSVAGPSRAQESALISGHDFAERYCAGCHAIGTTGASPLPDAPPFRTLHQRYPVDNLAEALAEGIITGHPEMPRFAVDPRQIDAFIAYLRSLD
ncbi:MAG: cytochrome c [Rhodobacteraceae bacterium]|nr:cytochrome c [Paracoccaceae bacterium]